MSDDLMKQERGIKEFLRAQGYAFEEHRAWIGYGGKRWITDFYLPESEIIIEAKQYGNEDRNHAGDIYSRNHARRIDPLYKDLFKLDELGSLYHLTKVLCLNVGTRVIPFTLIQNITAHGIYLISDISQLVPIIQGKDMMKINAEFQTSHAGRRFGQLSPEEKTSMPEFLRDHVLVDVGKDMEILLKELPLPFQVLLEYAGGKSSDTIVRLHTELHTRKDVMTCMKKAVSIMSHITNHIISDMNNHMINHKMSHMISHMSDVTNGLACPKPLRNTHS